MRTAIVIVTCLNIPFWWLIKKEVLPLTTMINYSESQLQFIKGWLKIALFFGIIIPLIMLIVLFKETIIRQFLGFYLLVFMIQIKGKSQELNPYISLY